MEGNREGGLSEEPRGEDSCKDSHTFNEEDQSQFPPLLPVPGSGNLSSSKGTLDSNTRKSLNLAVLEVLVLAPPLSIPPFRH